MPLLAGILDLVPWLEQWHDDEIPEFGMGMGDYYRKSFLSEEARALGVTREDLKAYRPPEKRKGRQKKGEATA